MKQHDHEPKKQNDTKKRVIRLDDLDWEDDVIGGSGGKLFFGEQSDASSPFDSVFKPDGSDKGGTGRRK